VRAGLAGVWANPLLAGFLLLCYKFGTNPSIIGDEEADRKATLLDIFYEQVLLICEIRNLPPLAGPV
jgi:hypothetical protein